MSGLRQNTQRELARELREKGEASIAGGPDAKSYLRKHWPDIRSQLLAGTYRPQPVRRVEIPKPDGGIRKLGVPVSSTD